MLLASMLVVWVIICVFCMVVIMLLLMMLINIISIGARHQNSQPTEDLGTWALSGGASMRRFSGGCPGARHLSEF